jgi:hypothetical protein
LKPFLFTKISTTDDDEEACADEAIVKAMGSLQMRYNRVKISAPVKTMRGYSDVQAQRLHEKSKKATLSHQAGYVISLVRL